MIPKSHLTFQMVTEFSSVVGREVVQVSDLDKLMESFPKQTQSLIFFLSPTVHIGNIRMGPCDTSNQKQEGQQHHP